MKKAIAILVFCLGCESAQYELYIDRACTEDDRAAIRAGIKKVNAWVDANTGEAPIDYMGLTSVNHDRAMDPAADSGNDGKDVVVCFYDEPDHYAGSAPELDRAVGWSGINGGDVWLFGFLPAMQREGAVDAVILHELGHYIGIRDHATDPAAVMADPASGAREYTAADTALLCDVRTCNL
jgi:hypothetical protein